MEKLTQPQIALLKEAYPLGTTGCVDNYRPLKKLLTLGLMEPTPWSSTWRITDEGRAALRALGEG